MAVRRLGLIALAALQLTAVPVAESQDFLHVEASMASERLFRGYDRGDGWSVGGQVAVGLAGFAIKGIGRNGWFLDVDGGGLLDTNDGSERQRDVALSIAYVRKLGSAGEDRLRFAYRQSFFGDDPPSHSEELFARYETLVRNEKAGLALHPFVEIAHDFKRYEGTYAAVGFEHAVSLEKRLKVRGEIDLEGRLAWSNQDGPSAVKRNFGFHHARLDLGLAFEREVGDFGTISYGPFAAWDRASDAIRVGDDFLWGARVRLVH